MKRGCYRNSGVKCPYYNCQNNWVIYCNGIEEGQAFHIAFADTGKRTVWQKRFCGYGNSMYQITGDYKECKIFKLIDGNNNTRLFNDDT